MVTLLMKELISGFMTGLWASKSYATEIVSGNTVNGQIHDWIRKELLMDWIVLHCITHNTKERYCYGVHCNPSFLYKANTLLTCDRNKLWRVIFRVLLSLLKYHIHPCGNTMENITIPPIQR